MATMSFIKRIVGQLRVLFGTHARFSENQYMFLNKDEIRSGRLVQKGKDANYRNVSYDLSIGRIVDMHGKEFTEYKLRPQGMIYVVFQELLKIPDTVVAFAHVRTTLIKRGIMATNIGIIDPGYSGYISTLLINFGSTECFLVKDERALRVTFARVGKPEKSDKPVTNTFDEYLVETKKYTDNLDEKFLNLNSVEKEVSATLIKRFFSILALFSVGSFLVSMYFQMKTSNRGELDREIKQFEIQVKTLEEKNKELEQRLNNIAPKVSSPAAGDSAVNPLDSAGTSVQINNSGG